MREALLYVGSAHASVARDARAEIEAWESQLEIMAGALEDQADELRALLVSSPGTTELNYTGPEPSVECAYPPCNNRLRYSEVGLQYCSKAHREAGNAA